MIPFFLDMMEDFPRLVSAEHVHISIIGLCGYYLITWLCLLFHCPPFAVYYQHLKQISEIIH